MINLTVQGDRELERKLLGLELKVSKKVVRKAGRKALKPVMASAKENARNMVGGIMGELIAKSLILRAFRRQRKGSYGLNVRLRSGVVEFLHTTADGTEYYIPAAIEYGHDSAAAIPFMRSAFDSNNEKMLNTMQDEIWRGILLETGAR